MPVLQVRLSDEDHERMRKLSGAAGLSASEMVRRWINGPPLSSALDDSEVEGLREEVKRLKQTLASRPAIVAPVPATRTVREPILIDREDSPFMRPGGFGVPRPAPKPSAKAKR